VLIFCMAQWIMFFNMLDDVASDLAHQILGFDSIDKLVASIIAINLTFLVLMVLSALYDLLTYREVTVLKIASTRERPELSLKMGLRYHSFISHIWATGQDQAANIKRKLQLLIPGIQVFLDVDDLEDIKDLELYVMSSQSVLIFLSKGYFFSENCLRELDCALASQTELLLVHEVDNKKGGAPLDTLCADCASQGRTLFADPVRSVIAWHRLADAQLLSLKMIAQAMLHCMPGFEMLVDPPEVLIPAELTAQSIHFRRPVRLFVSAYNPGAKRLGDELVAHLGDDNLELAFEAPSELQVCSFSDVRAHAQRSKRNSLRRSSMPPELSTRRSGVALSTRWSSGPSSSDYPLTVASTSRSALKINRRCSEPSMSLADAASAQIGSLAEKLKRQRLLMTTGLNLGNLTHMLLYLNDATFVGEAGQALAWQVKRWRTSGLDLLLVHEKDENLGGCPFEVLFQTTPNELVADGLYNKIALSCYSGPHRSVSLTQMATALGAVRKKSHLATTIQKAPVTVKRKTAMAWRSTSAFVAAVTNGLHTDSNSLRRSSTAPPLGASAIASWRSSANRRSSANLRSPTRPRTFRTETLPISHVGRISNGLLKRVRATRKAVLENQRVEFDPRQVSSSAGYSV